MCIPRTQQLEEEINQQEEQNNSFAKSRNDSFSRGLERLRSTLALPSQDAITSFSYKDLWTSARDMRIRQKSLTQWVGPYCLPMLLVIQPAFTLANLRTILALSVLAFIVWFYRRRTSHTNSSKKAWNKGVEKHCEKCDNLYLEQLKADAKPAVGWGVRSVRRLPWRLLSRNLGALINAVPTWAPYWISWIVIWVFVRLFGCKIEEAERDSITEYVSLGDFFTRKLKPGLRPISAGSEVVSPADGTVTFNGSYNGGFLEQVKGVHYSLNYFLGIGDTDNSLDSTNKKKVLCAVNHPDSSAHPENSLLHNKDGSTALFQWVIYLSPGDYHRFHSPADWTIEKRRHFPGELLSVKPNFVSSFPGLFHVNERVAWLGKWRHGFFSMTAVGATNVGAIRAAGFDPELRTNTALSLRRECVVLQGCSRRHFHYNEKIFGESNSPDYSSGEEDGLSMKTGREEQHETTSPSTTPTSSPSTGVTMRRGARHSQEEDGLSMKTGGEEQHEATSPSTDTPTSSPSGVTMRRGDDFGHFEFGSTLVLIFEAPKNFAFQMPESEFGHHKVQMGNAL